MKFLKLTNISLIIMLIGGGLIAQTDLTNETKLNQSAFRKVSPGENLQPQVESSNIPKELRNAYSIAGDTYDGTEKARLNHEIEKYLTKTNSVVIDPNEYQVIFEQNAGTDWYNSDIQVYTGDISSSSFRTMDMQQAEDGRMYLAYLRRNVAGVTGSIRISMSQNGGATWPSTITWNYGSLYIHSMSMLVERRDNNDDSTRIFIYFIGSTNSNFNDAALYLFSSRRSATGVYSLEVATPTPGNKFTYVSACSDGMFTSASTYTHVIVREESNAGTYMRLNHFRSTNWGISHTVSQLSTANNDLYPSVAFSNEIGTDSIYIAVERHVFADEWEIRLIATDEIPSSNMSVRYVTDATSGIQYERPAITIQQRSSSLPQRILVTCTKNDRAVYHGSVDGGGTWGVDYTLGLPTQTVDYTSCSSDTLTAGDGYFMAAYVDLNGDSVTVRRGIIGNLGITQHRRNSNASTSLLAPVCAIYKEGSNKYSSFAYAGVGPSNIFYNMESLITGISQTGTTIPNGYSLLQNYPNPFNPSTNIEFAIPKSSFVKLVVYDVLGRVLETLVNEKLNAGIYKADWNASSYTSGIYFYKIESEGFTETKKMILVK